MMEQPTEHELRTALRICKVFSSTPQRGGALADLKRIRDRKTTWVGQAEVALMFEIDKYIADGGGGFENVPSSECSICNGAGKVSDGYEDFKCTHCDGTGST